MPEDNSSKINKNNGSTNKFKKKDNVPNNKNMRKICTLDKLKSWTEWGACSKTIFKVPKPISSMISNQQICNLTLKERKKKDLRRKPDWSTKDKRPSTLNKEEPNNHFIWMYEKSISVFMISIFNFFKEN